MNNIYNLHQHDHCVAIQNYPARIENSEALHYALIMLSEWGYEIREELLRPIFIQSGHISKNDHLDRLIFLSDIDSIFYYFQLDITLQAKKSYTLSQLPELYDDKDLKIGFDVSIEKMLLDGIISTKKAMKELIFASGLVQRNDSFKKLRVTTQGKGLFSIVQKEWSLIH
ncbi:hypothetical protein BD770DRAFT_416615 [Pilaira anomala]|nr:hypothetical protein BD770DRAFT_416615 [Pilaira anomala]